nr:hypothetical protein BaRGS_007800 [Batillaria attramentaria]
METGQDHLFPTFKVSLEKSDKGRVVLAFFNCFAGGVFLGTCLLNMQTEGQEQFEEYKETVNFQGEYPFFQLGVGTEAEDNININREDGGHAHGLIHVSGIRAFLLLVAMSFHTIFDGLAVGLQETTASIWSTAVAISIHKAIVAVCLGLELAEASPEKPLKVFLSMLFFSFMAPAGVAVGLGVTSGEVNIAAQLLTASVLQAVATGVFLYVTFLEVLGPELQSHHLGVAKVIVATLGFAVISAVKILDKE